MQYDDIKELIEIFEKTDLNDMELCIDNVQLRLNRSPASPWGQSSVLPAFSQGVQGVQGMPQTVPPTQSEGNSAVSVSQEQPEKETQDDATVSADAKMIKAPIVGTFYQSSAPDHPPYVKVGDDVQVGDVVCIIEAMKFMNEVTSEESGTIAEVLVEDGQFVEFGQPLFRLK